MNQQNFVALLRRAGARGNKRTPFCVDDDEIAAYVDGTLEPDDHRTLERHLADCNACSGRVGLLFQLLRGAEESEQPPNVALDRVRRLGKRASKRAAARPIPLAPPVTTATRPLKSNCIIADCGL